MRTHINNSIASRLRLLIYLIAATLFNSSFADVRQAEAPSHSIPQQDSIETPSTHTAHLKSTNLDMASIEKTTKKTLDAIPLTTLVDTFDDVPALAADNKDTQSNVATQTFSALFPPNIAELRQLYRQAKRAIENNDPSFSTLRQSLENYPLAFYLDYLYLKKNIGNTDLSIIERHFATDPSPIYLTVLKRKRLSYLANSSAWAAFLEHYDESIANDKLKCHLARAMYQTGDETSALELAKQLWLTPSSMPDACNSIFHLLTQTQLIDSDLAWQRFSSAFPKNEITLSKYLRRFLKGKHLETAELIFKLYKEPKQINSSNWKKLTSLLNETSNEIASKGIQTQLIKRLARSNLDSATHLVSKQLSNPATTGLSKALHQEMLVATKSYIMTRHALQDYNDLAERYKKLGKPNDTKSIEWLIRAYIASGNWKKIPKLIDQLPLEVSQSDRWRYWHLRALQLAGKLKEADQTVWIEQSQDANFYGFYTANLLEKNYNINPVNQNPNTESIAALANTVQIKRAIEHFIQEEMIAAQREWLQGIINLEQTQLIESAYLASLIGWHHQAINTAARAKAWKHYSIRFPNIYTDQFQREAFRYNHMPQWFYATARQESALASNAQSHAGAVGLMQILPSTAKQLAKKSNVEYRQSSLLNPDYSIRLGSAYLAELYSRYGNRALSSAAYNAGPHRVNQWLKNLKKDLPLDAWIETIRFSETRQYVQNILSFSLIHATMHNNTAGSPQLWPNFVFFSDAESIVKPYQQQVFSTQEKVQ